MAILTNENDLTHIVRTTEQWENTVDKYEVIPEGVLCVEFTPKNKTNIKIGDGHKIFRDLPYVTGIDISKYYNKEETDNRISEILDEKKVVRIKGKLGDISELPTSNNNDGDVWFVKLTSPEGMNSYKEYVWFENKWELFGGYEDIDISKFATKEDVNKITKRIDDYVADGSIHKHANKDILDQTNAVFNKAKDDKLASLKNYDDTELKKWVSERAHTHPNKDILDQTNAVFDKAKDEQLENLEDIPDRVQSLENIAHKHDNKDILDRTTASFTKEQAIQLLDLVENGGKGTTVTHRGIEYTDVVDGLYDVLEYVELDTTEVIEIPIHSANHDPNLAVYRFIRMGFSIMDDSDTNIIRFGTSKTEEKTDLSGCVDFDIEDGTLKTTVYNSNGEPISIMHNPKSNGVMTRYIKNGDISEYDYSPWKYYYQNTIKEYVYKDKPLIYNKMMMLESSMFFHTPEYAAYYGDYELLIRTEREWLNIDPHGLTITGRIYDYPSETSFYYPLYTSSEYSCLEPTYVDRHVAANSQITRGNKDERVVRSLTKDQLIRQADIEFDNYNNYYVDRSLAGDAVFKSPAHGKFTTDNYLGKAPAIKDKSIVFGAKGKRTHIKFYGLLVNFDPYKDNNLDYGVLADVGHNHTLSQGHAWTCKEMCVHEAGSLEIYPVKRRSDGQVGFLDIHKQFYPIKKTLVASYKEAIDDEGNIKVINNDFTTKVKHKSSKGFNIIAAQKNTVFGGVLPKRGLETSKVNGNLDVNGVIRNTYLFKDGFKMTNNTGTAIGVEYIEPSGHQMVPVWMLNSNKNTYKSASFSVIKAKIKWSFVEKEKRPEGSLITVYNKNHNKMIVVRFNRGQKSISFGVTNAQSNNDDYYIDAGNITMTFNYDFDINRIFTINIEITQKYISLMFDGIEYSSVPTYTFPDDFGHFNYETEIYLFGSPYRNMRNTNDQTLYGKRYLKGIKVYKVEIIADRDVDDCIKTGSNYGEKHYDYPTNGDVFDMINRYEFFPVILDTGIPAFIMLNPRATNDGLTVDGTLDVPQIYYYDNNVRYPLPFQPVKNNPDMQYFGHTFNFDRYGKIVGPKYYSNADEEFTDYTITNTGVIDITSDNPNSINIITGEKEKPIKLNLNVNDVEGSEGIEVQTLKNDFKDSMVLYHPVMVSTKNSTLYADTGVELRPDISFELSYRINGIITDGALFKTLIGTLIDRKPWGIQLIRDTSYDNSNIVTTCFRNGDTETKSTFYNEDIFISDAKIIYKDGKISCYYESVSTSTTYRTFYVDNIPDTSSTLKLLCFDGYDANPLSFPISIYHLKIWKNDELIRYFIPTMSIKYSHGELFDVINESVIYYWDLSSSGFLIDYENDYIPDLHDNVKVINLNPATKETLGGIKVGSGLSITEDGVLSSTGGGGSSDEFAPGKNITFTEGAYQKIGIFTLLEYIESYQAGYIRTDYIGNSNTDFEFEAEFYTPEVSDTGYNNFFGAMTQFPGETSYHNVFSTKWDGTYRGLFGRFDDDYFKGFNLTFNSRVHIKTEGLKKITQYVYATEETKTITFDNTMTLNHKIPYTIFCENKCTGTNEYVENFASARMYYFKIYENGTLVRHYVPCISDYGEIGIIDILSEKFLPAIALDGKQFSIGDPLIDMDDTKTKINANCIIESVSASSGISVTQSSYENYELLEYISANLAYADTDIKLISNRHTYNIKWKRGTSSSESNLVSFGSRTNMQNGYIFGSVYNNNTRKYQNAILPHGEDGYSEWRTYDDGITSNNTSTSIVEGSFTVETNKFSSSFIGVKTVDFPLNPVNGETVKIFGRLEHTVSGYSMYYNNNRYDRLYYLDIFDSDVLVAQLRPAKRLSDNKIGLLNLITNKFYSSTDDRSLYEFEAGASLNKFINAKINDDPNVVTIKNTGVLDVTTSSKISTLNVITADGEKEIAIPSNFNEIITLNGLDLKQLPSSSPNQSKYPVAFDYFIFTMAGNYFDTGLPISNEIGFSFKFNYQSYSTNPRLFLFGDMLENGNIWGLYWDRGVFYFGDGSENSIRLGYGGQGSSGTQEPSIAVEYIAGHIKIYPVTAPNSPYFNTSINLPEIETSKTIKLYAFANMDSSWGVITPPSSVGDVKIYKNKSLYRWLKPTVCVSGTYGFGYIDLMDTDYFIYPVLNPNGFGTSSSTNIFAPSGINILSGINASKTNKGVVQIGDGINVSEDGVISVSASSNYDDGDGIEITESDETKTINVKYGKGLTINDSNELEVDINAVILNCIPD